MFGVEMPKGFTAQLKSMGALEAWFGVKVLGLLRGLVGGFVSA
jgi:hypothetical protein